MSQIVGKNFESAASFDKRISYFFKKGLNLTSSFDLGNFCNWEGYFEYFQHFDKSVRYYQKTF